MHRRQSTGHDSSLSITCQYMVKQSRSITSTYVYMKTILKQNEMTWNIISVVDSRWANHIYCSNCAKDGRIESSINVAERSCMSNVSVCSIFPS